MCMKIIIKRKHWDQMKAHHQSYFNQFDNKNNEHCWPFNANTNSKQTNATRVCNNQRGRFVFVAQNDRFFFFVFFFFLFFFFLNFSNVPQPKRRAVKSYALYLDALFFNSQLFGADPLTRRKRQRRAPHQRTSEFVLANAHPVLIHFLNTNQFNYRNVQCRYES
jgi:hypothetical protein